LNPLLQGAEDLNNDFYLKENIDGTVIFESVPNKGRFVAIPYGSELLRNFFVNLVVSVVLAFICTYFKNTTIERIDTTLQHAKEGCRESGDIAYVKLPICNMLSLVALPEYCRTCKPFCGDATLRLLTSENIEVFRYLVCRDTYVYC